MEEVKKFLFKVWDIALEQGEPFNAPQRVHIYKSIIHNGLGYGFNIQRPGSLKRTTEGTETRFEISFGVIRSEITEEEYTLLVKKIEDYLHRREQYQRKQDWVSLLNLIG